MEPERDSIYLKVGEIEIGIKTDTDIIKATRFFQDFLHQSNSSIKPDIKINLMNINKKSLNPGVTNSSGIENKINTIFPKNTVWNEALLKFPSKYARLLQKCNDKSTNFAADLQTDTLTFIDFSSNEIDIFYTTPVAGILSAFYKEPRFFSQFLPFAASVLFHGAAILRKKRVAVFLAPDEGGKTTIIKNLSNGICLSDDHILVQKKRKNFIAHGTPWGIYKNSREKGIVGGLFLLKKSSKFRLDKINQKEVIEYLWNEHLNYYSSIPRTQKIRYFNFLADLSRIPCYLLHFSKESVDWAAIDDVLHG